MLLQGTTTLASFSQSPAPQRERCASAELELKGWGLRFRMRLFFDLTDEEAAFSFLHIVSDDVILARFLHAALQVLVVPRSLS